MRAVKASEFKAKCLKLMDEVAATAHLSAPRDPSMASLRGNHPDDSYGQQMRAAAGLLRHQVLTAQLG